jgi:hypothetical protein
MLQLEQLSFYMGIKQYKCLPRSHMLLISQNDLKNWQGGEKKIQEQSARFSCHASLASFQ